MSFSNDVRSEICYSVSDNDKRFACLYGMLLFCRTLTRKNIYFQSESEVSARFFGKLFGIFFRKIPECVESARKDGSFLYTYDIRDSGVIEEVFRDYRLIDNLRTVNPEIIARNSIGYFVGGIFLACGSVNDPSKEYHLEFSVPSALLADELGAMLKDIGVCAKTSLRRGQHIVYIKGSESIEDTLTFMGAQNCTLEIMNVKIYKDVRNKANRLANCDSANIDKVVRASMKQTEDIKLIYDTEGAESLSGELRELAEIRLENPDMSLKEIGDILSISRSGVNHRFKRIAKTAEKIKNSRREDF
ncbi:MAG: DNA-binding protein WhiA [Ruminococcus sp.]|nr:DNA-binding protein WhiA [Ruminococcus sp.]